jgi:hypothetical protein
VQPAQDPVLRSAQAVEIPKVCEPHCQVHVLALVPQRDPRPRPCTRATARSPRGDRE